jgi:exodeoxyribonuclease VIII
MNKILTNLSRDKYEIIEAVNYSVLKHFDKSAAHAREEILHPKEPTKAMEIGNAIHLAILEPDRFRSEYVLAPQVDRRTKEGKAEWARFEAENPGKSYLKPDEWQNCLDMIQAIKENEVASEVLYNKGANEISVVWEDAETGLICKGRLDRFTQYKGWSVVIDIKTTTSAVEAIFASQTAKMNYHLQAAFYLDGLNTVSQSESERRYLILAIEKERPFGVRLFELDNEAIEEGRYKYRSFLKMYKQCIETNIWPGYPAEIKSLSLPKWAIGNYYYIESEESYD